MKNFLISLFKGYSDLQPTEATLEQIVNLIRNDALVSEHTEKHHTHYTDIDDRFVNSLWCRMNKDWKTARISAIRSVLNSEYVPLFNPFVEHFKQLKPWDGITGPIGQLASTVHVKGDNNRILKDDMLTLTEFALICLEEIDEIPLDKLNQLKAMVTMKVVNERTAYAHYKEHRPHSAPPK